MDLIYIIILGILGYVMSWFLWNHKVNGTAVVCHFGHKCEKLTKSAYSNIFSLHLELIGIIYFALIIIGSILALLGVELFGAPLIYMLGILGAGGAFASFILLYIQLVMIQEWCEHCLCINAIAIVIFLFQMNMIF